MDKSQPSFGNIIRQIEVMASFNLTEEEKAAALTSFQTVIDGIAYRIFEGRKAKAA